MRMSVSRLGALRNGFKRSFGSSSMASTIGGKHDRRLDFHARAAGELLSSTMVKHRAHAVQPRTAAV